MRDEVVVDQSISFHKPNEKVRNEKMMDHRVPQTKQTPDWISTCLLDLFVQAFYLLNYWTATLCC